MCVAIDLWKYTNSGRKAFLLPNGTVRLHHAARQRDLYAAVCKQTGWDYIEKDFVENKPGGDIPLTPPDYRALIVEV